MFQLQRKIVFISCLVFSLASCTYFPMEADDSKIEILFLGDLSFGENYQERRAEKEEHLLESRGYASSFTLVKPSHAFRVCEDHIQLIN